MDLVPEKISRLGQWSLRLRVYPNGYVQQEHFHREFVINIVLSGTVSESMGRTSLKLDAWNLYCRPPGVEHRNEYGGGLPHHLARRASG